MQMDKVEWFRYSAVDRSASPIGNGTARDLIAWVERLCMISFPENHIERFSEKFERLGDFAVGGVLPAPKSDSYSHIAVYHSNAFERGLYPIEIMIVPRGKPPVSLAGIKTIGASQELKWAISQCISDSLESILKYGEIPLAVKFSQAIPLTASHNLESDFKDIINVETTSGSIRVSTSGINGKILHEYNCLTNSDFRPADIAAHREDWITLLKAYKLRYLDTHTPSMPVPHVPGAEIMVDIYAKQYVLSVANSSSKSNDSSKVSSTFATRQELALAVENLRNEPKASIKNKMR